MRPLYAAKSGVTLLALALFASAPAAAQTQTVLFPGQTGAELRASLRAAYRPTQYGTNDNLYSDVDRTTVNGQSGVVCVYTGLFVPFDGVPNADPSQDVFNGGSTTGNTINQEHTWPQAQLTGPGDPSPAERDLHNLYPTQVGVNADRGNLPFAEIDDAVVTRWYRGGPPYTQTTVPTSNVDEYSELVAGSRFEPREDHQGNVSRSMFYMETVYPEETNEAWLAPQLQTLYEWHRVDPITAADQARSARVATFQSGKDNPFVLDSTLIRRAFFPDIVVADEPGPALAAASLRLRGAHPFTAGADLDLRLVAPAAVRAEAFDALGRRVAVLFEGAAGAGTLALRLDGAALAPGVYVVRVVAGDGSGTAVLTRRLVRAR